MRKIIFLLLLTIASCGERESGSKTKVEAPSFNAPAGYTSEEYFAGLKPKAESGDARSQMALAKLYYNGDGVAKDDAKAAEWYRKAAEQGNALAQYKLGAMYDKGEGVPKDAAKAVEWWKKAAAQGDEASQESLKQLPGK